MIDDDHRREETAEVIIKHVWKLHGLLSTIISDRGPQFVSLLSRKWCQALGIKARLSSGYQKPMDKPNELIKASKDMFT